jgi:hypothetical protein
MDWRRLLLVGSRLLKMEKKKKVIEGGRRRKEIKLIFALGNES